MRDVTVQLQALCLHGMAGAWCDLQEQGRASGLDASRWLAKHCCRPRPRPGHALGAVPDDVGVTCPV